MGLYNRFCKRFFAAVIIRLTAQSDSRAPKDGVIEYSNRVRDNPLVYSIQSCAQQVLEIGSQSYETHPIRSMHRGALPHI